MTGTKNKYSAHDHAITDVSWTSAAENEISIFYVSSRAGLSQFAPLGAGRQRGHETARARPALHIPKHMQEHTRNPVHYDGAWSPMGIEENTFFSVALDFYAKENVAAAYEEYWIRQPGVINSKLVDLSPQHVAIQRLFRNAAILTTASVFTKLRDAEGAERCSSNFDA
jgi:hypothetical protein